MHSLTTISILFLVALTSAIPIGPSLYELFRLNHSHQKIRWDLLFTYIIADSAHVVAAWFLSDFISHSIWSKFLLFFASIFMFSSAYILFREKSFHFKKTFSQMTCIEENLKIFNLTIFNAGIFIFYLSLFSNFRLSIIEIFYFLSFFIMSLLVLLIITQRAHVFIKNHEPRIQKTMALIFTVIGLHFLLQI